MLARSLLLELQALREALTTGGRPCILLHRCSICAASPRNSPIWRLPPSHSRADDYAFGHDLTQTLKMKWTSEVLCHFQPEGALSSCKGVTGSPRFFFFFSLLCTD
jgi:hypothetical protein